MLTFYLLAAALTVIACMAVLLPFIGRDDGVSPQVRDIDVYRDQLAEIDADEARDLIGAQEAAEARAELGRRILRAASRTAAAAAPSTSGRWLAVLAIASIPLTSWALYGLAGSPGMPDQPLAGRLAGNPADNTVEELIARAERHLETNPLDGRGWSVVAPIYLRTGRNEDAVAAYRRALTLLGEDARTLAGLGEAIVAVNDGTVTPEAAEAFERSLALSPGLEKPRFFLALALAQAGDLEGAAGGFREMIAGLPEDSPWREVARQALARVEGAGAAASPADDPLPMIEGMVASLAARLEENPLDPEGWERLIRSYVVLDRKSDALDALARARSALAGEAEAVARLDGIARELGLVEE